MKPILFTLFSVVFGVASFNTANAFGKKEKVTIVTSGQCDECIGRMTEALNTVDGVKSVKFNGPKEVTIVFDDSKTNADALRDVIVATGYDADGKTADASAYKALPACCQKGGH
jgi:periplasmic mercuric ion binding protein